MQPIPDILAAKASLRRQIKELRAALPFSLRAATSERLTPHAAQIVALATTISRHASPIIAGFLPFGAEIDPGPLMVACGRLDARLVLPRMNGDDINFHLFRNDTQFEKGAFGIREPRSDTPQALPDLLLTPLLAFDRCGRRLGYGRGYYDRAIVRLGKAVTVGVAFAAQEVPIVPVELHDRSLDFVLTENGLIDCRR